MAATEKSPSPLGEGRGEGASDGALSALLTAALALPILAVPARAGAAEVGEVGIALFGYRERGPLMKISEPIAWARGRIGDDWEVQVSGAIDIVTGASPQLVTNRTGTPVQTITGASVSDRRNTWDAKVARRFGEATFAVSRTVSKEEDYRSHAYGLEGRYDLNGRNTTLTAGFGQSNDRIGSSDDPRLDEPRNVKEYLGGVTQVLSPVSIVQSTLMWTRGRGWFNDPYKLTLTFYPDGTLILVPDRRPSERDSLAWLTRYRHHFPAFASTLQAEYRFYRDDWGITAHTLELAWQRRVNDSLSLRPALRYHTQSAADFYSPVVPRPAPGILSSDQRLAAFGGLTPSLRLITRFGDGFTLEATAGYIYNSRRFRFGGGGSPAFESLRAYYGIVSIAHDF